MSPARPGARMITHDKGRDPVGPRPGPYRTGYQLPMNAGVLVSGLRMARALLLWASLSPCSVSSPAGVIIPASTSPIAALWYSDLRDSPLATIEANNRKTCPAGIGIPRGLFSNCSKSTRRLPFRLTPPDASSSSDALLIGPTPPRTQDR